MIIITYIANGIIVQYHWIFIYKLYILNRIKFVFDIKVFIFSF